MELYKFNFSGQSLVPFNEVNVHKDYYMKVSIADPWNSTKLFLYYIDNKRSNAPMCEVNDPCTAMLISCSNSAHSISEIISFLNYYGTSKNKVVISDYIQSHLPLLFGLIKHFISAEKIIVLNRDIVYKFKNLTTYRPHHFNSTENWDKVLFSKINNRLEFDNIQFIRSMFLVNSEILFNKVVTIYNSQKGNYILYDNVMLIKTKNDHRSSTIDRALDPPSDNVHNILKTNNIKYLAISDFKNINELICVLYHAKNVIFSYGGPCCTNRFFCNPNANVIVIANSKYKDEYYCNNDESYWHVRHSHLYPVKKQTFLLDFDNEINENNVNDIIQCLVNK
jgi:hypothetical protein